MSRRSADRSGRIDLHPLHLTFSDATVEQQYRDDYARQMLPHGQAALLLGCAMFAMFGPLDASVVPNAKHLAWLIRYGIVCPFILVAIALSYTSTFARYVNGAVALAGWLAGVGIVAMIYKANSSNGHTYYAGLSIVTLYIYLFSRLRFVQATAVSWSLLGIYVACVLSMNLEVPLLISNLFFLVATNIFCMSAIYSLERSSRTGFLQKRTIRAQEQSLAAALTRAEMLARLDPLTGLPNRRSFAEHADAAVARSGADGSPLSVIVLDIDHFKSINDRFGHDAGDRALIAMGRILPECLRTADLFCRWGGEEFAVVLPATSSDDAMTIAERLRLTAQDAFDGDETGMRITISGGVATLEPGEDLHRLFKRADNALYCSKHLGRNRVTPASGEAGMREAARV